jgi:Ca2+-binding RTX toxin-like protein
MPKKLPPHKSSLLLEDTLLNPNFALASTLDPGTGLPVLNPDYDTLIAPLGTLPGGPYQFAYIAPKAASSAGQIEVGASLAALDGLISTGNGKDSVNLSLSTADNLVFVGNANDTVTGGAGNDTVFGQNGNDTIEGNDDLGTFSATVDPTTQIATSVAFVAGDILSGGNGKDTFVYGVGDGVDQITDFKLRQDKLVLNGYDLEDLVTATFDGDLYIGFNDGLGGWTADSVIRVDNVTDINVLLSSNGILFA